jgi:hypothetical protein
MDESLDSLDWKAVAIVGEYTVPSGPYFDDHFLVIVTSSRKFAEIPSRMADEWIPALEGTIGMKISWGLCNRTDCASRVIFPPALAEHPVYEFSESPTGFWDFLKPGRHLGVTEMTKRLTKELEDYLQSLGHQCD